MNAKKHLSVCFILLCSLFLISCSDAELTKSVNATSEVIKISEGSFHDQCLSAAYNERISRECIDFNKGLLARLKSLEARVQTLEKNEVHKFRPISE